MYKVGPAYRLGNETDIMQEILTSGPVQGMHTPATTIPNWNSAIHVTRPPRA